MTVDEPIMELQPYIEILDAPAIPLDTFGVGARVVFKVIPFLVALTEEFNETHSGVFLWEEPELFHIPITLQRLLNTLVELINGKNIQVFITTQVLRLLRVLRNR